MRISQKSVQLILLVLIVAIGLCADQFGYVRFIEKANAVKEENKAIEARINELTEKETHREEWNQAIAKTKDDTKAILAKYGPGNTPEKSVMFVRALEDAAGMQVGTIGFNPDSVLFVSSDLDENGNPAVEIDSTYISLSYNTTYDGLKECMKYINNYPERMNVQSFTSNFNQENGQLAGNMIINLFGVKDADHKYLEPSIGGVETGTDNIFGTVDVNLIIDTLLNGEIGAGTGTEGEGEGGAGEGTPEQ